MIPIKSTDRTPIVRTFRSNSSEPIEVYREKLESPERAANAR